MKFKRWNSKRILDEFSNLNDKEDYEIISCDNVKNAKSKFKIRCCSCNTIFEPTCINFFIIGTRCSICSYKQMTKDVILKKFSELHDANDYVLLDVPEKCKSNTKITIVCKRCGSIIKPTATDFINKNTRCRNCSVGENWSTQKVANEFEKIHDKLLYALSEFANVSNSKSVITIKCLTCFSEWKTTPHNFFISKRRCPVCKSSYGERLIYSYLGSKNIKCELEKTFPTLKHKRHLRFDFYVPEFNLIIEFHGEQHFLPNCRLKITKEKVIFNQLKDKIKKNFALSQGMNYLEIHYDEIPWMNQILDAYFASCIPLIIK